MRRLLLLVAIAGLLALTGCVEDFGGTDEATNLEDSGEFPAGEFELHHIDVGQADATLVIAPNGETMLVDSGDWRADGEQVLEYLEERDITRIDHLVATHGHADHIGGHAAIIDHFETEGDGIGAVYDSGVAHTSQTYENYLDAVESHDLTLYEVREGDHISLGEAVNVSVLNPPAGDSGTDLHDNSVTLSIEYGEVRYLTTGDAETDAESRLVEERKPALDSDIYQAGHHGSSTSSTEPFLAAVDPGVAVISSGFESQYGHPHDEVLRRFAALDIRTYWTGVHGDIVITSDGSTIAVEAEHDESTDPETLLDEKPSEQSSLAPHSTNQGAVAGVLP